VNKVTDRFDDSVTEYMVRTYLLENIGKDEEPEYVVNTTGSDKATDWVPGYPFRKADTEADTWRFEYNGDDVAAMRSKWRNNHQTGSVEYGDDHLHAARTGGCSQRSSGDRRRRSGRRSA